MNKKQILITTIIAIITSAGGFLGGTIYQKQQTPERNFNFAQRGQFQGNGGQRQGIQPVNGEIISKDDNSITVKLADGSSKIVIIASDTKVNKTEESSIDDLSEGENVVVFGQQNSDGTTTALNIQLGTGGLFVRNNDRNGN